jgi:hypothetical protein
MVELWHASVGTLVVVARPTPPTASRAGEPAASAAAGGNALVSSSAVISPCWRPGAPQLPSKLAAPSTVGADVHDDRMRSP